MYSKEMSILVASCDCFNNAARKADMQMYGIPYVDVKVGHGTKFDKRHDDFEPKKLWLDLNYCPQCGAKLTRIDK